MAVPLDEAGHRHPALQLDHLRFRSDQRLDVRRLAGGDDPRAADGNGLGLGLLVVDRDDRSAAEHEVGGLGGEGGRCEEKVAAIARSISVLACANAVSMEA